MLRTREVCLVHRFEGEGPRSGGWLPVTSGEDLGGGWHHKGGSSRRDYWQDGHPERLGLSFTLLYMTACS